jgi:hypothetical protein
MHFVNLWMVNRTEVWLIFSLFDLRNQFEFFVPWINDFCHT